MAQSTLSTRRQILTWKVDPRTERVAVDYRYGAERANQDIYDDFKLKKTLWFTCFMQKYFNVVRAKLYLSVK